MTLYVVATPIGNLGDMTMRAIEVLRDVDCIAAEDTRHSKRLLSHFDIHTNLIAYHEHNEEEAAEKILARLVQGESFALISDAGTPLVSDPGYRLVRAARDRQVQVVPVPGASSVLSALSVSGLATDRFCFEGFLPSRSTARQKRLSELKGETRTLVLFEAPHRIGSLTQDVANLLGEDREVVIARELTKQFEQVWSGMAGDAVAAIEAGEIPEKGEFVVVLEGSRDTGMNLDEERVMSLLLTELSPGTAASLAGQLLGTSRKHLYDIALALKKR